MRWWINTAPMIIEGSMWIGDPAYRDTTGSLARRIIIIPFIAEEEEEVSISEPDTETE